MFNVIIEKQFDLILYTFDLLSLAYFPTFDNIHIEYEETIVSFNYRNYNWQRYRLA